MKVSRKAKDYLVSYSFCLPFLVFFLCFVLGPILYVFYLSFQNGTFLDPQFEWTGIENYKTVLTNPEFQRGFLNSFIYIVIEVPVSQFLAIFLALLLRKKKRVTSFLETVYFLPMLLSMVVASVLISYVLSVNGPLNAFLELLGLERINWVNGSFSAKMAVMILELWKGGMFFVFVYMSAMRSVSLDCLESAKIDGCNPIQESVYIILPLIRNAVILCVTMNTIWQFQIFDSVYMLTGGGPMGATETVIYNIYQYSFKYYRVGYGAAAAVVFLFVILIIYGIENLLLRERKGKGAAK